MRELIATDLDHLGLPRRASWLLPVVECLIEQNVNPSALLSAINVGERAIRSHDALISLEQEIEFLRLALDACAPHRLGLLVGSRLHSSSFGVLGLAMMCSADLQSALDFVGRHIILTNSHFQWTIRVEGHTGYIVGTDVHGYDDQLMQYLAERDLAASITYITDSLGRPFKPINISLPFSPLDRRQLYAEFFNCEIQFESERLTLSFDATLLSAKLPQSNQLTFETLERMCEKEIRELRKERSFARLVEMNLVEENGNFRTLNEVASILNVDPRTVRRRLSSESTSYKSILDTHRRNIAIDLLKNSQESITAIAEKLGFSESAAFFRAFKRWTGKKPAEYR